MRRVVVTFLLGILLGAHGFSKNATAQDDPGKYPFAPELAPESNEGEQALSVFTVPAEWTAELWAAEPMLGNPVAFTIDNQGRLFVCESFRQDSCVTDNRDHNRTWVDRDLAAETVEDRIAYHKELLPQKGVEYTKFDDRIRVLILSLIHI